MLVLALVLVGPLRRLAARSEVTAEGCWRTVRESSRHNGYVTVGVRDGGRQRWWVAHRLAYTMLVGPVPAGYELDHVCHNDAVARGECAPGLCRHRRCWNPAHLEPVTHAEHLRHSAWWASKRAQTHCVHGHEFTPANTIWRRSGVDGRTRACRTCQYARQAAYEKRKRGTV